MTHTLRALRALLRTDLRQCRRDARLTSPAATELRPVFIVGSGRSGNTLLRRMLMAKGEIYIPPETYVLGRLMTLWRQMPLASWDHRVRVVIGYFATSEDFAGFPPLDSRAFYDSAMALPAADRSLAGLLDHLYRAFAAAAGYGDSPIWGDKTPLNTFSLPQIRRCFPQARFVYILRDPYDATASYCKMGRYSDVATAAKRWRMANDACLNQLVLTHPQDVQLVQYEALVKSPEDTLKALCPFLGLTYHPEMVGGQGSQPLGDVELRAHHARVSAPVDTQSIGKGRRSLSEADTTTIRQIVAPTLERLRPHLSLPYS